MMTHPGLDAAWLLGVSFLLVILLVGVAVPFYAVLFAPPLNEQSTRLERVLHRFGAALLYFAMFVVAGLAVALGIVLTTRIWRLE